MSMSIIRRTKNAYRAFVGGASLVSPSQATWGVDNTAYTPAEYGDYLATSNAVYVCAQRRAKPLAALPPVLYRGPGDEREPVEQGELYDLLQRVNPFWTFSRLLEMTELSLCLWGSCYWFLERGASGRLTPREIWWVKPSLVKVVPHPQKYISHFVYESPIGGPDMIFQPSEVIWLRYSNPIDQFSGLSPLAAARLAADSGSAAMKSNRNLFLNGMQMGGFIQPHDKDIMFTPEQAQQLENDLSRRFRGVDKAHRWAVLRFQAELKSMNITPKDAEFLGLLNWSLEDVARAYGVPIDLVGGQRTYQNVREARQDFWSTTLLPEARFIADELTEQLLPLFPGHDFIEFDTTAVLELQHDASAEWTRANGQIRIGAITINEWRTENGLEPVEWGDLPPARVAPPTPAAESLPVEPPERGQRALTRAVEYGSAEHERLYQRFVRRIDPHEAQVARAVTELFIRQRDSVLEKLRSEERAQRSVNIDEVFDMARWIKLFRTTIRPILRTVAEDAANNALDDLGLILAFDVANPALVRFLEQRAQRFAERINETTWAQLKTSLVEGVGAGENIPQLAERVEAVMAERIRSSKEVIARTEVLGAANGGTLDAWQQSEVVDKKVWLAALDDRTRDSHVDAHGQTVGIDENFIVGNGSGPTPGQIGLPEEDIQCRCSMTAIIK